MANPFKKKEKKMKLNRLFLLVIFTAIICIILVYLFYQTTKVYAINEISADLIVGDYIGFNTDINAIHFGTILPGMSSNRDIIIDADRDLNVMIKIVGNISRFISISENNFLLKKNEKQEVKLTAIIPLNATKGIYSGVIKITFLKEKIV